MGLNVRKHGQSGFKSYQTHRFIWECFNGLIPDGKEIDHINNIKSDNRLSNLQLLTPKENGKKAAKYRNDFNNHKRRRCVKATCLKTGETSFISACIRFNNISKLKIHQLGKFVKSFNTTNQLYQRKMVILIHSSMSNKKTYQMISKNHLISDQKESQMRKRRKNKWTGKTRSINVQNVIKSSRIFPNTNTMKNVLQNSNQKQ